MEHDFILAPGANPQQIRLSFSGAQKLQRNDAGDLALQTEVGEVKLLKPIAWQELSGQRQPVECEFIINNKRQVGFRLGAYDRNRDLVIDPVLLYSTYLGGGGFDWCQGVAVDKDANAYVVGYTNVYVATASNGLYKSTNGGQSYQVKNTGFNFNGPLVVNDLAIDYAGFARRIYRQTHR